MTCPKLKVANIFTAIGLEMWREDREFKRLILRIPLWIASCIGVVGLNGVALIGTGRRPVATIGILACMVDDETELSDINICLGIEGFLLFIVEPGTRVISERRRRAFESP